MSHRDPQRTCIGCRERGGRKDLERYIYSASRQTVEQDVMKIAPGRGAWIHPDQACLDMALKRQAFGRALKISGKVTVSRATETECPQNGHTELRKAGRKPMGTR